MPYDEILKDDPRPFLHGECFFLVYHERTDVAINPGLRELWASGSADPDFGLGQGLHRKREGSRMGLHPGHLSGRLELHLCVPALHRQ